MYLWCTIGLDGFFSVSFMQFQLFVYINIDLFMKNKRIEDPGYNEFMAQSSSLESKIRIRILTGKDELEKKRLNKLLEELLSSKKMLRTRFRERAKQKQLVQKNTTDLTLQIRNYTNDLLKDTNDLENKSSYNTNPLR